MSGAKIFDESYYLSNNADVDRAISQGQFASALHHYQLFGGKSELRDPNATFDASYYSAQNPDVLAAVSNGLIANVFTHYQIFGEVENRPPSASFAGFDTAGYLAANADVQAALDAGSFASALEHYIAFGASEGRDGGMMMSIASVEWFTLPTVTHNVTNHVTRSVYYVEEGPSGTVYHVSASIGSNSGDGSEGNPFLTIS